MNKLSKPKSYDASPNSVEVMFGTEKREVTNLRKSGITVQSSVLVADSGKWHEINVLDLGADDSNLENFKEHIQLHNLTLSDLGIVQEQKTNYGLTQTDFEDLSKQFPIFSPDDIRVLHEWEVETKRNWSIFEKRLTLKMIERDGKSIQQYIRENSVTPEIDESEAQIKIACDTVPVPVPVPVPENSVSLQVFEKLTPERITELQGLKTQQEGIVLNNPVITITDKKTYDQAKRTASILLSASTSIDCPKKGKEAEANRYLNNIKKMLSDAFEPIKKITRDPYNQQKKLIEDWDNRILLQQQERVKRLCAVTFVFDGVDYSIGNFKITKHQLENTPDNVFDALVKEGENLQKAIESLKSEQDSRIATLEKQNAELLAKLEALLPKEEKEEPVFLSVSDNGSEYSQVDEYGASEIIEETITDNQIDKPDELNPIKQYQIPHPDNKLLNKLDLDNWNVFEQSSFQLFREGYVQCMKDVAAELKGIMLNEKITKSLEINKLIEIWKM